MTGVLIDESQEGDLISLGVKDSKLLTPRKRQFLYGKLKKLVKTYKVILVQPYEIESHNHHGVNLNDIEALKAAEIINELKPDKAYLDCPSPNIRAWKNKVYENLKNKSIELIVEHKAEKYPSVGAASIIGKVIRDYEIEKIKEKIGVDFGSLHFNEEVLIEHKNKISLENVGQLVEEGPWNIKVFSLNMDDYSFKKCKVTDFIEHPETAIYNLELERGKIVRISANHEVFCLDKNLKIVPKKLKELKIEDFVAVSGGFNNESNLKILDLVEILKEDSVKKSPIYVKVNTPFIKINQNKIRKIAKDQTYNRTTYYGWLKNRHLPLNVYCLLNNKNNFKLCSRESNFQLDRYFKINDEFMWFLGIYIAEGWLTPYNISISNQDKKVIERIKKFANSYGLNYYFDKKEKVIHIYSILMVKIIKNLVKGNTAYTKEIPQFVFSTEKNMIKSLLEGLYEGDGYNRNGNWEIELRSKKIITQLQWLNLMLGKFSTNRKRFTKPSFITRTLSKSTNSLSPDNIPNIVGTYIKNLRIKKKLKISELSKRINIDQNVIIRIERLKGGTSLSKNTLKKISKVLPDKNLLKLINSDICWLKIKKIQYSEKDKVYDLGVRYKGFENFLGGTTGIILHNSGYSSDPKTKEFLKENIDKYPEIFRKTWSTYTMHKDAKKQKSLNDF